MPAKLRLMPHRTTTNAAVAWGAWTVSFGEEFIVLPSELTKWDFASECTLRATVSLDEQQFLETTGLSSIEDVELVAQVDCPSTYVRITEAIPLKRQDRGTYTIEMRLAPGQYSSQILLSLHLILARDLETTVDSTVATRRGSRLGNSESMKVQLGSTVSKFPTEALPFTGALPADAPWILNITYSDLDDAFLGAARLFLNTNHPGARVALDESHPSSSIVRSALRVDVARSLILQVASRERSNTELSRKFDPNSIGYVTDALCRTELKGILASVIRLLEHEPSEFEARLQANLGYLRQVEEAK